MTTSVAPATHDHAGVWSERGPEDAAGGAQIQRPRANRPLLTVALAIGQSLVLHFTFMTILAPTFFYIGERYRSPEPVAYVLTLIAVAVAARSLPSPRVRTGSAVASLLFAVMFLPIMVVPQIADVATPMQSNLVTAGGFVSALVVNRALSRPPRDWLPVVAIDRTTLAAALVVSTLALDTYIVQRAGLNSLSTDIGSAYEIRDAYRAAVADGGGLLGYAVRLVGNVLAPTLITLALYRRRLVIGVVGALSQVIVFSATGYKVALLATIFIVAVFLLDRFVTISPRTIIGSFLGISFSAAAVDTLRGTTSLSALLVDRLSVMSGLLPTAYVSFFADAPKALWTDSFLRGVLPAPYDRSIVFLAGVKLTGNPDVAANSNFLADGYANWGVAGVLVELAVLIALLRTVITASRGLPIGLTTCLLITPMFSLANSSPLTAIISSGFVLLVPVLLCLPRAESSVTGAVALARRPPGDAGSTTSLTPAP